jgi:23S rRNA (guanosine2251-2'-O)-methyltransferase
MITELLYGRRPVYEALRAGRRRIYKLLLAEGLSDKSGPVAELVSLARDAGVPVTGTPRRELDRVTDNHQGVVAQASPYAYFELDQLVAAVAALGLPPLFLLLDLLQDPQNFGSLLRTAEAVGVHGIIIPDRRAVGVTPAVVSASAGAVEHLRVAQVTNLARTIEELKEHDVWVAGLEATPGAELYDRADLRGPLALVVGSEGSGLRRLVREKCDFLVRLPMHGRVASLNAAVAGSVALYEVDRQRRLNESETGR